VAYNIPAAQQQTRAIARMPASSHADNFNQPYSRTLYDDRAQARTRLARDPALHEKILRIMYNEQGANPQGTQAVAESLFNRASMRGETLDRAARWHRAEPNGYYAIGGGFRGNAYQRYRPVLERSLQNALNGSNIANYATDNSSGGLARREMADGSFKFQSAYTGETFSSPQYAERGNWAKWQDWSNRMIQGDQRQAPATAAAATGSRGGRASGEINPLVQWLAQQQQQQV
jgi:hypothetical protein